MTIQEEMAASYKNGRHAIGKGRFRKTQAPNHEVIEAGRF